MTYDEKKSLYESIMKDVAKVVKQKIDEGSWDVGSRPRYVSDARPGTFEALDELIDDYISFFGKNRKGLFIKISDPDLSFPIFNLFECHYKNETLPVYLSSKEDFDALGRYELPGKKYIFAVIDHFDKVEKDAYPTILKLVAGNYENTNVLTPIVIISTFIPDDNAFMKRFRVFELKY